MKILFIGDVFGEIGREAIALYLYQVITNNQIDLVIANVENTSHGKGLLKKHYDYLKLQGIQVMTMGNHTFDKKELFDYIDEANEIVVPINQPKVLPGIGSRVFKVKQKEIRVTNVLGNAFMDTRPLNPFEAIDEYLDLKQDIHIIDFHGETTSEKIAFAYYVKDKVSAVLGTHTHVQTADEKIIDQKCAFISDVGMTGPYLSAIGCDLEAIIRRMKGYNSPFTVAKSSEQFCGVILTFDENNVPTKIERILINQDHPLH